ncbi:unnamed protein product [Staurois parvus]|uniref:Uncharacterized protein n=1 Tax=Staurois parvus TaxID=386267 RepID=A0ABN9B6L9_9NEOB|nr:unnamed protein product [Staurois parvus]
MENRRSVRRPQSWHMAEWEQWEAVQGPRSQCGLSSSHEESVRGPMADYVPGSSNGRPVICQHLCQKFNTPAV